MLRIGLTGGIGSGKTTVAGIFEALGIPVYYADVAARDLMNDNETVKSALQLEFGHQIYTNGKLDRRLLSEMVFNNKERLQVLNSIVHPLTIQHADTWIRQQASPYVIKEAALLFESGANRYLHLVTGVSAPLELRIARCMARDGITREQVLARVNKQMDEEKKLALCDYVIVNDEERLLIPQVLELHRKFLQLAAKPVSH